MNAHLLRVAAAMFAAVATTVLFHAVAALAGPMTMAVRSADPLQLARASASAQPVQASISTRLARALRHPLAHG